MPKVRAFIDMVSPWQKKTAGCLGSGHPDVDFYCGEVRVLFILCLVRLRHQNTASLNPERVNMRQPVNGRVYTRPILGRKLLRQGGFNV